MSFINKVKNFFYEEVEEDDDEFEARENAKREAKLRKEAEKRRKIEEKRRQKELEQEEIKEFVLPNDYDKPSNDNLSERELFETEKTFNFPMDIGDDIFDQTEVIPEIKEESRNVVKEEKNLYARSNKTTTATSVRTTYKDEPDDEPKRFHPSPVVSPVYGILDKNYTVEDVVDKSLDKTKEFSLEKKTVDFDTVRNRAYKELDEEIEKTLTESKDIFYNLDKEEKGEENTGSIDDYIEETYDKDENDTDEVIITYEGDNDYQETETTNEEITEEPEDEEEISPDVEIPKKEKKTRRSKKVEVEEESEPEEDEEKEDLFNLIDNMYSEDEDDEEEE